MSIHSRLGWRNVHALTFDHFSEFVEDRLLEEHLKGRHEVTASERLINHF